MTAVAAVSSDLDMGAALARAITDQSLVVHFLPEIELASGAVTGMEAVLRWAHPRRGLMWSPEFMPLAERTGLAGVLGWALLRSAAAELASWRKLPRIEGQPQRQMWVPVSAGQLLEVDFVERVASLIAEFDLAPDSLGMQVGEDTLSTGSRHAPALLGDLRRVGVALMINNVGSWYAGIATMGDLPVQAVKLDRAFVRGVGADLAQDGIVSAVVALAHAHGLRVVADSVESWSEGARLCELGCDRALGYLFSGPQDAEDARLMLSHGAGWYAPAQRVSPETEHHSAA